MAKPRGDIPLGGDPASRLLPWIIGFMAYIAALALSGALVLDAFSERWNAGLTGTLTIQIPPPAIYNDDGQRFEALRKEALAAVRSTEGVATATLLPLDEMRALLKPWLGESADPRDLPLPRLIAVTLKDDADIDMKDLLRRLEALEPGITIDDHGLWRERLTDFMTALQLAALAVVGIVALAAVVMVIFATRGGLLAHRESIELLHLIGARDRYIAAQFQGQTLVAALKGGIVGTALAAGTVVVLGHGAAATGAVLPGAFVLEPVAWLWVLAVPAVMVLIALATARRTVIQALVRMV